MKDKFYTAIILIGMFFMTYYICNTIYSIGFVSGYVEAVAGGNTSYVKKWLIKEGNILKYPFRKNGGQTSQTSDSDCVQQSGKEPEKEKEKT